jgi:iron(III) transport system substrate-binding protein
MRVQFRGALILAASFALGSMALAACGSSAPGNSSGSAGGSLVQQAKAEGQVYVYSVLQDDVNQRIQAAWNSEYGIPLTIEKVVAADLDARYEAEASAGAVSADAVITSDCGFIQDQVENGSMTPITSAVVPGYPANYPKQFQLDNGAVPIVQMDPWGIGYNTDQVTKADAPTTWQELLEPKWKGKILMVSPLSSAAQTQSWDFLIQKYGVSFVKSLVRQAAQFYPSTGPAAAALAAGEGDILIPTLGQVTAASAETGAPENFTIASDTTATFICAGESAKAPHSAGARLFMQFLLSKAGSAAMNMADLSSVGPFGQGIPMPAGYVPPADVTTKLSDQVAAIVGVK